MPSPNPASILDSVKKVLGVDVSDTSFDLDIIMHINSVFGDLLDLGVGSPNGFVIIDNTQLWVDYTNLISMLPQVKTYMYLKVRSIFDPPANQVLLTAMNSRLTELEFRINVRAEELNPPRMSLTSRRVPCPFDHSGTDPFSLFWEFVEEELHGVEQCPEHNDLITNQLYWWDLTGGADFPPESVSGDYGADFVTGDIWRRN